MKRSRFARIIAGVAAAAMLFAVTCGSAVFAAEDVSNTAYVFVHTEGSQPQYANGTLSGDNGSGYVFETGNITVDSENNDAPSWIDDTALGATTEYESTADITVTAGDITFENAEEGSGFKAVANGDGKMTVTTGSITSSDVGVDLYATGDGEAEFTTGDIEAEGTGIRLNDYGKQITVQTGEVTAGDDKTGVYAQAGEGGSADVTTGSVEAGSGVVAQAGFNIERMSNGEVNVTVNGDVTAKDGPGAYIVSSSGESSALVSVTGDLKGQDGAVIDCFSGSASLEVKGDVNAENGTGIVALGPSFGPLIPDQQNPYYEISDPENVDGQEILFDDEDPYILAEDGTKIYVIWDEDEDGEEYFHDQNGNELIVGFYYDEDEDGQHWYVLNNAPEENDKKAPISISVGGDVFGTDEGLYVESVGALVDVLVEGTIEGGRAAVFTSPVMSAEDLDLTVWKIELNENGNAVETAVDNEDDRSRNEEMEKRIMYIVKLEQPKEGGKLSATDSEGADLKQSHEYSVANEGDKVIVKVDLEPGYKILAAYNGDKEKAELLMDSDGNYYLVVPKGGGVYLSVELGKEKYDVTFADEDGTVLQNGEVEYGETPSYGGKTPEKASTVEYSYTFAGWTPEVNPVTGDITYTATYTPEKNHYLLRTEQGGKHEE